MVPYAKPEFALPPEFAAKFMLSRQLGAGACGVVRLCFTKCTDERFAVKIVEKQRFSAVGEELTNSQVRRLSHQLKLFRLDLLF